MAKLARDDERTFNPLSQKLIDRAAGVGEDGPETAHDNLIPMPQAAIVDAAPEAVEDELPDIETPSDRLTESMRYRVSRVERREIDKFVGRLSDAAGMTLTHSNLMRAARDVLLLSEEKLIAELRRLKLKRPINDRRALTIFEAKIAEVIHSSILQVPLPQKKAED